MKNEQDFISAIKAANKLLFAAEKIQIKPESWESLLRRAYQAGKDENKSETPDVVKDLFGFLK